VGERPVAGLALAAASPPESGVDVNTSGYTSQIYASLTWAVDLDNGGALWPDHAVLLDVRFGPAYSTGHVQSTASNRLSLGSNLLFHPAIEMGYRLTSTWSISVYFERSSNAGLSSYNDGLSNLGVRVGLRF